MGAPASPPANDHPLQGNRPRPRRRWAGVLLLAAGLLATSAAASLVVQNRAFPALYAERYGSGTLFQVTSTLLEVGASSFGALGTEGNEVQMNDGYPDARTPLTSGHQWYTAVIKERTMSSATSGTFTARLYLQETLKGTVFLRAGTRTDKLDGATVTWDLGLPSAMPQAPLFVVDVQAYVPQPPTGPVKAFGIESVNGDLWRGVSAPAGHASIAGVTSPTLNAATGDSVQITWTNQDGGTHALRIKDPGGAVVAGPSASLGNVGQSTTLSYTVPSAGTYRYECPFHSGSMWGNLVVS